EIFFVDLPDAAARAEIFGIHLAARGRDPGDFDLERLSRATEGFSGAEIEEVVVSTHYHAFSTGDAVTAERLLAEAERTRPLSVTRAEEVEALRGWARGRTRSASAAGGS
ncbi:MAG TPA: hypothetical protein VLL48_14490, partial [Longimicrobiales bacterium]|nr:hypothetical protein [Longimicrobiales bacterium]